MVCIPQIWSCSLLHNASIFPIPAVSSLWHHLQTAILKQLDSWDGSKIGQENGQNSHGYRSLWQAGRAMSIFCTQRMFDWCLIICVLFSKAFIQNYIVWYYRHFHCTSFQKLVNFEIQTYMRSEMAYFRLQLSTILKLCCVFVLNIIVCRCLKCGYYMK